jgi:hypothetical protein
MAGTSRNAEWRSSQNYPMSETYAERAKECRALAKLSPWREGYLDLAAKYEQMANTTEYDGVHRLCRRSSSVH